MKTPATTDSKPRAFDRAILMGNAMNDAALADEVLGLFLQQLHGLRQKDWASLDLNFEMHTLKGSAATVGAAELEHLARTWHTQGHNLRPLLLIAIAGFEKAAK